MHHRKLASLLALIVLFSAIVMADNTLYFRGEVTDQTCEVRVNGTSDGPLVLLPTVHATELNGNGFAGETRFTMSLDNCSPPEVRTPITTVFVGNAVTRGGNLGNTGTAENVELQLLERAGGEVIDLKGGATEVAGLVLEANEDSARHDFAVRYYTQQGNVSAGSVAGSVQYVINYQ